MTNTEPESDNIPVARLPNGYSNWLDYALSTLDVRALEIQALFNEDSTFDRDAVRFAARQELDELRNKAAALDKLLAKSLKKPTLL